jgi:hypothetical protein
MVGDVGRQRAPASRVRFAAFGALDPGFVAVASIKAADGTTNQAH